MKEKISLPENETKPIVSEVKLTSLKKKKTRIIDGDDIKSLPAYEEETKQLTAIQTETENQFIAFMHRLSEYEKNNEASKRDPFIQWIINNNRYKIRESYSLLKPKLIEQISLLKKSLSTPVYQLKTLNQNLITQCETLTKEIDTHTQLLNSRLKELESIANPASELSKIITQVKLKERRFLKEFTQLEPIEIDDFNPDDSSYAILLIEKIEAFITHKTSEKLELTLDLGLLNKLHIDDRDSILFLINQAIQRIDATQSQMRKNNAQMVLDCDKFSEKGKILSNASAELIELCNEIKGIIQKQPMGELNRALEMEKSTFQQHIDFLLKQAVAHSRASYKSRYQKYMIETFQVQSNLANAIHQVQHERVPNLKLESERADFIDFVDFINQFNGISVVKIDSGPDKSTKTIDALQKLKVKPKGIKALIYEDLIQALQEANKACMPLIERENCFISYNEQLAELRNELKNKFEEINQNPLYKNQIFFPSIVGVERNKVIIESIEVPIVFFFSNKEGIEYSNTLAMKQEYNNYLDQQNQLLKDISTKIKTVNTSYKQKITVKIKQVEEELINLEVDENYYGNYKQILNSYLTQLQQLKTTIRVNPTHLFEKELEFFNKQSINLAFIMEQLEEDKRRFKKNVCDKRLESAEVQCIARFIDEIRLLNNNQTALLEIRQQLESAKEAYTRLETTQAEFHQAIANIINNTMLPAIHEMVPFYDDSSCKNFIHAFLLLLNDILEFLTERLPVDGYYKPQFFSKEIEKCELAITAEKARVVLVELNNSLNPPMNN